MSKNYVKVPIIMQMEALECGAACLAMILAYYGKWIPLEEIRSTCGISRDGSSAKNIIRAAKSYGLIAKGYKTSIEQLKTYKFPCILFWEFNHFVVLNGFKKNCAIINDPARGTVSISMDQFNNSFTGVCLKFEPGENFKAEGKPKSVVDFAKSKLKGTLTPFIFITTTGLITTIIGILNPIFSRIFLDRILAQESYNWLYFLIGTMSIIAFIQILALLIHSLYILKIQGKLAIVANSSFMWHVLRLPMDFFSQRMAGDIASRQISNEDIASTLISKLAPVVLNFCSLIFYLFIMIRYSLILTLIGVSTIIINVFLANIISRRRINITRVQMRDMGKLYSATLSGIDMIETVKSSGAENGFFEKWTGYQAALNTSTVKFTKLNQYLGQLPSLIQSISSIAILIFGVLFIMQGNFTVGMLLAFQGFMSSFISPVNSLIDVGQNIQEMRTAMERIDDVFNYKPDIVYNNNSLDENTQYHKLSGALEINNITFGYCKLDEPLIENFSLKLKPGARVAFVGASGCGKSTLSKLISGLYKPWSGEILFDGKPIEQITREVFTGSISVVDQDITMFEDSISNNLKMWDKSIEDFEMILSARDAHIHEDIMARDGDYSYKILEGGRNFSGGQMQRLEIARVLSQDPTIVILDEATSALDAKTEHEVVKSITDRGITCIIIAHRLSTIRDCDEIIVMDNGKVIERGTHNELMAKNGAYTKLITVE